MNVNMCVFAGRLTRDPESLISKNNVKVTKFGIAVNGRGGDGDTTFVDCVSFSKQAELIETYFKKGNRIYLVGRLAIESWEDSEGKKRTSPKLYVDNFQFVDSSPKNNENEESSASKPSKSKKAEKVAAKTDDDDGEVPF